MLNPTALSLELEDSTRHAINELRIILSNHLFDYEEVYVILVIICYLWREGLANNEVQ